MVSDKKKNVDRRIEAVSPPSPTLCLINVIKVPKQKNKY